MPSTTICIHQTLILRCTTQKDNFYTIFTEQREQPIMIETFLRDTCNNTNPCQCDRGVGLMNIYEVLYGLNVCNPRVKQIPPVAVHSLEASWWHELSINQTSQQIPCGAG